MHRWSTAQVTPFAIPLKQPLLLGQARVSQREGIYLTLSFADGQTGRGEIAPLPGFSRESLPQAHRSLLHWIKHPGDPIDCPSVAWGVHCAMQPIPAPLESQPDYPLLMGELTDIHHRIQHWPQPLTRAKLKVARLPLEQDIARVKDIQNRWTKLQLRLDANQGWSLSQACTFAKSVNLELIEYLEQPCADWQACAQLAKQTGCPIALDESLQSPEYRFHPFEGLKMLVIKPMIIGASARVQALIQAANNHQLGVTISSSYESSLGLSHLQALAQASTRNSGGLDTMGIFAAPPHPLSTQIYTPDDRNK